MPTALRLIGPVGRGEVWTLGIGTAVTMTSDSPASTPFPVAAAEIAVHGALLVVVPALFASASILAVGPAAAVGPVAAVGWLAALLIPLLATALRAQSTASVRLSRLGTSGRVVRLHDLARHPADPAGTGSALLGAMLTEPGYRHDTVTTVAASPRLADRYEEAGLTRQPTAAGGRAA